jgi:transposase-like protein
MPCYQEITCPRCQSNHITQSGRNARGEQRYRCQNPNCQLKTFMRVYRYAACQPMIDQQMTKLAINGSGVQETASVLGINKNTVIRRLKKSPAFAASQAKHSAIAGFTH